MRRFRDYLDPGRVALTVTVGPALLLAGVGLLWLFA